MAVEFLPGCTGGILAKERLAVHSLAGQSEMSDKGREDVDSCLITEEIWTFS